MKKNIRTVLLPLFLITSAQAQNHHLQTSDTPMMYSNSVRLAGGAISPTGYAERFMSATKKDEVTWIFDNNNVPSGNFKLVLPFPLIVYRGNNPNIEMAFAATSDKQLILFRYWFYSF